jgi:hypothetical protein
VGGRLESMSRPPDVMKCRRPDPELCELCLQVGKRRGWGGFCRAVYQVAEALDRRRSTEIETLPFPTELGRKEPELAGCLDSLGKDGQAKAFPQAKDGPDDCSGLFVAID